MTQEGIILRADEGKVLRRIVSGEIFGDTIYLGYSHYIGGVLQNPPHKDIAEDFEEIDKPADWSEVDESEVPDEYKQSAWEEEHKEEDMEE